MMDIGNGNDNPREVLASKFIGTAISFVLHGITCCQVIWYFRSQSGRTNKYMKLLILLIWLTESLSCIFMVCITLRALLAPAIARARVGRDPCRHWSGVAQKVASEVCTFLVEGFFIMRLWKFSGKKKLTALAFIPYITGNMMGFAQLFQGIRLLCEPSAKSVHPALVFTTFGFKMFADSVTMSSMCYMLYIKSLGFTRRTNTIKVVRGLILWTISTGMLTWFNTVLIMACNIDIGTLPNSSGIYYVRTGLYANAMLAQLNARKRYQAMANETISHSINLDTTSLGQRANPDSQPGDGSVLNPNAQDGTPSQT